MGDDRADEIMRHFDVVAERLESQISVVAEGHSFLVNKLEVVDQHIADVRRELHSEIQVLADGQGVLRDEIETFRTEVASSFREVRQETGEIKAAIRLSYAEIDRRIRTLEGAVVSLADRVDRLEARKS
jgi:chromosome segregation ATPase